MGVDWFFWPYDSEKYVQTFHEGWGQALVPFQIPSGSIDLYNPRNVEALKIVWTRLDLLNAYSHDQSLMKYPNSGSCKVASM